MSEDELIDTAGAARALGVSTVRVRVLIREGRLPAQKVGRDYVVRRGDLAKVKDRPTGRPRSSSPAEKPAAAPKPKRKAGRGKGGKGK